MTVNEQLKRIDSPTIEEALLEVTLGLKAKRRAYRQRPEIKAKQRAYRQRPEIKARQNAYYQRPEIKAKQRAYFQRRRKAEEKQ